MKQVFKYWLWSVAMVAGFCGIEYWLGTPSWVVLTTAGLLVIISILQMFV